MGEPARKKVPVAEVRVNLLLTGARVTSSFRAALFSAAGREGISVNEFVLWAAAGKLRAKEFEFEGVFAAGDMAGSS